MTVRLILSGGQVGVDRGALEAAMLLGIPYGGYCPRGRRSKDGTIPGRYKLQETHSASYGIRTKLNVRHSDATLVIVRGENLTPGSALTHSYALELNKPCLIVRTQDYVADPDLSVGEIRSWLARFRPEILNIAGSSEPPVAMANMARSIISDVFAGMPVV